MGDSGGEVASSASISQLTFRPVWRGDPSSRMNKEPPECSSRSYSHMRLRPVVIAAREGYTRLRCTRCGWGIPSGRVIFCCPECDKGIEELSDAWLALPGRLRLCVRCLLHAEL